MARIADESLEVFGIRTEVLNAGLDNAKGALRQVCLPGVRVAAGGASSTMSG
jgi:hypothetical protein